LVPTTFKLGSGPEQGEPECCQGLLTGRIGIQGFYAALVEETLVYMAGEKGHLNFLRKDNSGTVFT
jgi:hypothetical protein